MNYLKAIIKRIDGNETTINELEKVKSDKELMKRLLKISSQEEIEDVFTKHYGLTYKKMSYDEIDKELLKEFNDSFLQNQKVLPYKYDKITKEWTFAVSNIIDREIQNEIKKIVSQKNQSVKFTFMFDFEIEEVYSQLKNNSTRKEIEMDNDSHHDAISWVEMVINNGIEIGASDIHIEREDKGLQIRYRVDGVMTNKHLFTMNSGEISNIYVRLKIIGNMDISEKRRSQDGRIDNYEYKSNMYSLRVSTVNRINGEKFVMRLFPEDEQTMNFDDLGFTGEQQEKLVKMINSSNGIIYLAGATGSGKTTTLYAMINNLDTDALNVYTIESPVEKGIIGVNQIQIDEASGNTYPSVLGALLRQDPDAIAVGEIREEKTAKIAVQASLTGHLVLTTIHANNALDSLTRLSDIGIENYLIGASSVGFISQRLARRLCPYCKKKVHQLPEYQAEWLRKGMEDFNYDEFMSEDKFIYEPVGCNHCLNGYKGRIAIAEMIEVDEKLKSLIAKGVESKDIKNYLNNTGFKDMKFDGVNKVLSGLTSVQEVMGKLQD